MQINIFIVAITICFVVATIIFLLIKVSKLSKIQGEYEQQQKETKTKKEIAKDISNTIDDINSNLNVKLRNPKVSKKRNKQT